MPRKTQGRVPLTGLGKAIINAAARGRHSKNSAQNKDATAHILPMPSNSTEEETNAVLSSITDRDELDEFLVDAIMREQEFQIEKANAVVLSGTGFMRPQVKIINESTDETEAQRIARETREINGDLYPPVKIPRRPAWDSTTTAAELDRTERESFVEWRRYLLDLEEKTVSVETVPNSEGVTQSVELRAQLTPFEKNIEIWRQLWRVLERCTVIAQIVDARNPLLFRCEDLETYAHELNSNKRTIIILNKADLLTDTARQMWADYFHAKGIKFAFFSAVVSSKENEEAEEARKRCEPSDEEDSEGEDREDSKSPDSFPANEVPGMHENPSTPPQPNDTQVLSCSELLNFIRDEAMSAFVSDEERQIFLENGAISRSMSERLQIGMVGYPNVGKSSTINALLGTKRVTVGATPGKTKHFQTLPIGNDFLLCDCPGLVFPTFLSSRADLVCNGIMPIDQMKTYENITAPVDLLLRRVGTQQLQNAYGLIFPPGILLSGRDVASAHARLRGFMKDHGRPDESKSARILLKDLVNGKLLYCNPPPALSDAERNRFFNSFEKHTREMNSLPSVAVSVSADRVNTRHEMMKENDTQSIRKPNVRVMEQLLMNEIADNFEDVKLNSESAPKPKDPATMSKKEFLRSRQRPRGTHGKGGKKRKTTVPVSEVSARIAGNPTVARNVTPCDANGNPLRTSVK